MCLWAAAIKFHSAVPRMLSVSFCCRGFCYSTIFALQPDSRRLEGVGGIFCSCYEVTGRVISERWLRTLRDLGQMVNTAKSAEKACEVAATILKQNPADVPFALLSADAEKHCFQPAQQCAEVHLQRSRINVSLRCPPLLRPIHVLCRRQNRGIPSGERESGE